MLEELELILETQRRVTAVREHEELHPPITEECPICIETISIANASSFVHFICCGIGMCPKCVEVINRDSSVLPKCPLCRAEFTNGEEEALSLSKQRAKDGRSWAQNEMGRRYRDGADGFRVNRREALKWLELAAKQRNPVALHEIYQIRYEGMGNNISGESLEKAMALLKESADLGYYPAQGRLAAISYSGKGGPLDMSKAAYYFTLAYSQKPDDPMACYHLGALFLEGWDGGLADGGFEKKKYRAKYYFEQAIEKGFEGAHTPLGVTLQELGQMQYNGINAIPGFSCIPRVRACFQKGVSIGDPRALEYLQGIERNSLLCCSNCDEDAKLVSSGKLSWCKRCKASWYCGRECQVKHWKAGHKYDCVEQ